MDKHNTLNGTDRMHGTVMASRTTDTPNMSREDCRNLFDRIVRLAGNTGETTVNISSVWRGNLRWANNQVITSTDTTDHYVSIVRIVRGARSPQVTTNKFDDTSLKRLLDILEYRLRFANEDPDARQLLGPQRYLEPPLFYDSTATLTAAARSGIGKELTVPVATDGLRAAGYLAMEVESRAVMNTSGLDAYARASNTQYSVTVRNAKGTGSGWAGVDHNDWTRIDGKILTDRARDKCVASADPRALEPGRYMTVLEPQAVHDLMGWAVNALGRSISESMPGPYHLSSDQSKLGLKLLDGRVRIDSDPMDPNCAYIPFSYDGEPYKKTPWFTDGVLSELAYEQYYALEKLGHGVPQPNPNAYRMSGGTTSIEEMVETTKRGLLVTRFSGIRPTDDVSLSLTGVTRDGLWLIENGKITYAVKNFRFNESPLFVFNSIEQLGVPVRVFSPGHPAVVPPVKVREFNFSSMADAV